jgi:hypothetical protein
VRIKIGFLTILFLCISIAFIISSSSAQAADSKGRTEISSGDRALAVTQVQNTFSKHAFYHQVGMHCEEMKDIWVKEDGEFAKTVKWTNGGSIYEGYAAIKEFYCSNKEASKKRTLEELSKKYPAVKNIPENLGAGDEYVMHTQETPIIEVAGDGKTAKGLWHSIGLAVRSRIDSSGNVTTSTGWMWEQYVADFVKEDGKWKMWHFQNMMDTGPSESGTQARGTGAPGGQAGAAGAPGGGQGAPPAGERGGGQGAPQIGERGSGQGGPQAGGQGRGQSQVKRDPNFPGGYNALKGQKLHYRFPEPYYTFSETFSY